MKETLDGSESLRGNAGKLNDLKEKERGLSKALLDAKKETSIEDRLDREIRSFESLSRKDITDYTIFISKLRLIKADLECLQDTSAVDPFKLRKEIDRVDALIEKYQKEKIDACIQHADAVIDRVQQALRT